MLVVLIAAAAVAYPVVREARQCSAATEQRDRELDAEFGDGAGLTVALTDSYGQGVSLPDGVRDAWPALLEDTTVRVDAFGGTGFVARGYCTSDPVALPERLADAVAMHPDRLIVQGGINDVREGATAAEVAAKATDLLRDAADIRDVIVVGPAAAPSVSTEQVRATDAALRQATEEAGRVYVSLLDAPVQFLPDQLHPTADGQRAIAAAIGG